MENNQTAQPPAQTNTQTAPVSKKSNKLVPMVLILLLVIATVGVYFWQHQKLTTAQASFQTSLDTANAKVKTLTDSQKLVALPAHSSLSPQCSSKDNSNLILAALTPQPIDNYQAYIAVCAGNSSIPAKVVALKVKADGTRSFAFGAGTSEPMCISSKIIDATAAEDISKATLVPICKTF